ncbi:hypothetical protein [Pedobacter sp.]|uniref:hypothetical protein n=1 Tax=Pedobacter sp. TaxID=1411316 RepID=UPI003BA8C59B
MKSNLIKLLGCVWLFWLLVMSARAQIHTDQNGLKTSVIDDVNAAAAQAMRYEVATIGFNSFHWQLGGIITVELFHKSYSTGYERYIIDNGFGRGINSGNPQLYLAESAGVSHLAKVVLGQAYDQPSAYGDAVNKIMPVYVDVREYGMYRVKITYQQVRVETIDGINQIKINTAPSGVQIGEFTVSTLLDIPVTSTQNLMISGIGPHYLSQGNVGIGTTTPQAKLHVKGGGMVLGSNNVELNTDGHLSLGDLTRSTNPDYSNWSSESTLLLNGLDYTTIGFHDSGNRGDFIRAGNGTIELGYDGCCGHANIKLPEGIWNSAGNVGIGLTNPSEKLTVNGKIKANEIRVNAQGMPDYVFAPAYQKLSLSEIENYIQKHKHLPEIPSAAEAEKNGLELGEMNKLLLKKIEELTLHLIDQDKELKAHKQKETDQEKRLRALEEMLLKR